MTPVTVKELIEFLQTLPQDLPIAYCMHSEQCLLELSSIAVKNLSLPRNDGWVEDLRPDKAYTKYVVFPGN